MKVLLHLFLAFILIGCSGIEEISTEYTITLLGDSEVFLDLGEYYQEMGAICIEDGNKECEVKITGDVIDVNSLGTYTLKYSSPNELVYKVKTITILDVTPPVISVRTNKLFLRQTYDLYDYISVKDDSGEILSFEVVSNSINIDKVGTYVIKISAIDSSGNRATEEFNFIVEREFLTALSQSWANIYTLGYYFNSNLVLDKYQVSFRFVTRSDFYVTGFTLNLKVTYQYRTSSGSLLYKTEYLSFSQLGQTRTIIFPGQGQMGAFTYEIFTVTGNVYKN